jgi:two-component system, OmpR family, sensor histidine kinase SenX3
METASYDCGLAFRMVSKEPRKPKISRKRTHSERFEPGAGALSIVAHDLRGPLANLSLLIEGMACCEDDHPRDRVTHLAQKAERLIGRLDAMLTELLQRARASGDPLAFTPSYINIAELVDTVIAHNEPLARSRSLRLRRNLAEPTFIWGCQDLLMQALDNLLNNAIRHSRRGGQVECEVVPLNSGGIEIRIVDEGPGLTPRDVTRAFRPFTQLSAHTDSAGGSTGLGLWIVRIVAERHGGHVQAANRKDGTGAVFTLCLPQKSP